MNVCNVNKMEMCTIAYYTYTATHFTKTLRQVLHVLNAILKIYCELKNISANLIKHETVYTEYVKRFCEHSEFLPCRQVIKDELLINNEMQEK